MKKLTKREFNKRLDEIREKNVQKEYQRLLNEEKAKCSTRKKIETSKIIAIYLFVLLNVIVIYAMVAMWRLMDLTYLGVLITDIASQVLIYAIYCMKAYKAKKAEEEMSFKRERYKGSIENILESAAENQAVVPVKGDVEQFVADVNDDAVG